MHELVGSRVQPTPCIFKWTQELDTHGRTVPASLACSLVKQFAALRKKAETNPTDTDLQMLTNLINALKNMVSMLRERTHDALLSEILGIKLWNTAPVGG